MGHQFNWLENFNSDIGVPFQDRIQIFSWANSRNKKIQEKTVK